MTTTHNQLSGADLLEKLIAAQLIKKSSVFYGSRMHITPCTEAHHWALPRAKLIQSRSHLFKKNIILPFTHRSPEGPPSCSPSEQYDVGIVSD
jgi:hypothetical protein